MIGINSQIESPSGASAGVGFAIPINIAKRVVPELVKNGEVRRPKLGVTTRAVESLSNQVRLPVSSGALIINVVPDSGAARAGLRGIVQTEEGDAEIGDIIVGFTGRTVNTNADSNQPLNKLQV